MLLVTMVFCGSLINACSDDDDASVVQPLLNVSFVSSEATEAQFDVIAKNISECVYLVKEQGEEIPTADVVFATGEKLKMEGERDTVLISDLKSESQLVFCLAAKDCYGNLMEKVESVSFVTSALPSLNVNFLGATATTAKFEVNTKKISEFAYLVRGKNEEFPSNHIVFKRGTTVKVAGNKDTIEVAELSPKSDFVLYLASKDDENFLMDDVDSLSFSTTELTETVTVLSTKGDGFKVHVKVPEEVKARGNALRFTRGVLPFYNMLKMQGATDAEMLLSNGGDERSTTDTITYTFDEAHSILEDPETGEVYEIDSPIVPGEPSVFLAGEFSFGESPYGWGEGYYNPLFDTDKYFEDQFGDGGMILSTMPESEEYKKEMSYWTGYHHRELVTSKEPTLLDGGIKVDTLKLSPINASFRFTPDENVGSYCVFVCDDALYKGDLMFMLDNNEKYLQWFTTSFMAFSQLGAMSFNGVTEFSLSEFYEEGFIEPGLKFHILITSLGDENGMSQSFQHLEIITPERTKPAPVVEVKGISNPEGETSPYEVWFNIKSVGSEKLAKGKYVANYERETEAMLSNGYDALRLVDESGNAFTEEEIEQINSAEGLNVRFDSRANACTYLIAMGYNDEGLNSEPVIGKNRSTELPAAEKFDSPYFKGLEGDWTASAYLSHYDYATRTWSDDSVATKFKVTIGNNLSHPETLPEDVYGLYEGMSKEKVDALYSEFKTLSKEYVDRLNNQNCVLCTGFDIFSTADSKMEGRNPYELFVSPDYSGYNNEALFFDFGPKWFLHITKDGKISVPVNMDYMAPLSNWKSDGRYRETYYLAGVSGQSFIGSPNAGEEWPSFPVEVSEDMKTISVKPMVIDDGSDFPQTYFPSPVSLRSGQAVPVGGCRVNSGITLTKGWNGDAAVKSSRAANQNFSTPLASYNGQTITPKVRPMARTIFTNDKQNVKRVNINHRVTSDEFRKGMTKLAMQWLKGQQNKK